MAEELREKQAIIERNDAATARMAAALERIDDEQMLQPNAVGDWSLRDALSHLANPWFAEQMSSYLEGRKPDALAANGTTEPPDPSFDLATNDGRNAWRHHVRRNESLEEVRERYRAWLGTMTSTLERLPAEDFERSFAIRFHDFVGEVRPAEEGEQGFPLWQWIRGEYWHHLEDHLPAFEAAAKQSR